MKPSQSRRARGAAPPAAVLLLPRAGRGNPATAPSGRARVDFHGGGSVPRVGARQVWMWFACVFLCPFVACAQPHRLARWSFESPSLVESDGRAPRSMSGVERVPGFEGQGVAFRSGGGALVYPLTVRGRQVPIDPGSLSLHFFFKPDWSSAAVRGGTGPGEVAQLLSIGDRASRPADGWWSLSVSADGGRLEFSTAANEREVFEASGGPPNFTNGVWSELFVTVLRGRVRVYVDDTLVINQAPQRIPTPGAAVTRQGIALGSLPNGRQPARGTLDEIDLFDTQLDRVDVFKTTRVISATPAPSGDALDVHWRARPADKVDLQRADGTGSNWVSMATAVGLRHYRDSSVEPGRWYRYRVLPNAVAGPLELKGGLRLPPVEDRGVVALLVDETMAVAIGSNLDELQADLVADGWRVIRHAVPRHDDRVWRNNTNAIASIRGLVQADWAATERQLRCVYLIGHVAIPYSGMLAEDTHTGRGDNHWGAWPADQYYGDVDGIWTDTEPYPTYLAPVRFESTQNDPGDGKFDTAWVPPNAAGETRLEAAFGRIDFANMPTLAAQGRSEPELLRQYLDKVRRYRAGQIKAQARTVFGTFFDGGADFDAMASAFRTGSRLHGFGEEELFDGDLFGLPEGISAVWGFQSGSGAIDRVRNGLPHMVTSAHIASGSRQPRVLFAMLLGSWFGDWALSDNLLRSILSARDFGLAAFWVRYTEWRFDAMAFGGSLADAQLETANDVVRYLDPNHGTSRTLTILGDPTLRLNYSAPPRALQGRRSGDTATLSWSAASAGNLGQLVYRSTQGAGGPFARLTAVPVQRREYVDRGAPAGAVYQVRTAEIVSTGSGSYTNLSLAATWPAK